jgi:hypothetical protein
VLVLSFCNLADEMADCDFGDDRLNKRACSIADAFSSHPNVSIPAAFSSRSDLEACYRFFDNDSVTPDKILRPHIEATYKRIESIDFVLLVQDTTEIDLTRPEQQVRGAGPMDCESRRGAFYHPVVAFTEAGVALGIVGQKAWTRTAISKDDDKTKQAKRRKTPIEDKESFRWIEGLRMAEKAAQECKNTTCVCVGDSESDIYDLFVAASQSKESNLQLLVRAGQTRNTTGEDFWMDQVKATTKIADQSVFIRARKAKLKEGRSPRSRSREARTAELEIRKATIEVARPVNGDPKLPPFVKVNVVLCLEPKAPDGEDPICWMLVTTLPIETDEDVQRIIRCYCVRWQIEIFFRTLKVGCRIEHRRFESISRILNCLTMMSVVSWRLMYICYIGRECPDIESEVIFEPSEWKSVYTILGLDFPKQGCPKLNDVVRAIAQLGGFVDRPRNEPGTQTLWVGLQRCYDLSNAWKMFGPDSKKFSPD